MTRFLVTGASGFIGGNLVEFLTKQGHEVLASSRSKAFINNHKLTWFEGSLKDPKLWELVKKNGTSHWVQLLSLNHRDSETNAALAMEVAVGTTQYLLHMAQLCRPKTFTYFSTQQVYGPLPPGTLISEHTPVDPRNMYGLTHWLSEELLRGSELKSKMGLNAIRLSNPFGPVSSPTADCWWLVIQDFCRSLAKHGKIEILSDGSPQRDFVSIAEVCRFVEFLARDGPRKGFRTINFGSGRTQTVLEVATEILKIYREIMGPGTGEILIKGAPFTSRSSTNPKVDKFEFGLEELRTMKFSVRDQFNSTVRALLKQQLRGGGEGEG